MTDTPEATRDNYIAHLRDQLFGPAGCDSEWLPNNDPPHKRYITGILFPRVMDQDATRPAELEEEIGSVVTDADEPDDSPLAAMLQRNPASAGLTFAVSEGSIIKIRAAAAIYHKGSRPPESESDESDDGPTGFLRESLDAAVIRFSDDDAGDSSHSIFDDRAEIRVRWRCLSDLRVVTVSIINSTETKPGDPIKPEDCLYQVELKATCVEGQFKEPPAPDVGFDPEEEQLRLRYRDRCAWATGHSTSASWNSDDDGSPPEHVHIDFLPIADIHPFSSGRTDDADYDDEVLSIQTLSRIETGDALRSLLVPFVDDHQAWIEEQKRCLVDDIHRNALSSVIEDLEEQHRRLKHGIEILCDGTDEHCLNAFRLANRAMLDQMERPTLRKGRDFDRSQAAWRPFQLAFQLLAIPGVLPGDEGHGRDLVDLIWFPTGGGKTEAYLLLSAFTIIYRRLRFGREGGGTCVLSRYTLRLLTSQQFERTGLLICALEKLRRHGDIPGDDPIDIGLWIGGGQQSSPNKCKEAFAAYEEMLEATEPGNGYRFMLIECPWCGHSITPENREEDRSRYGIDCTTTSFSFRCPDNDCEFNDERGLPIQVIDECMYASPPTILLATIDKFARLPWESRSRAFFGFGEDFRSPDLVLQDELHLISGPLGTIAAIYEAGIDVLIRQGGDRPKYVAATATIRGAGDQAKRLYGREVKIFPASGTDADDSYYMKIDRNNGISRRYVGIMGQGHTAVTNTVHVMAAMVDAGQLVTTDDTYWTLVAYHNSRRELGKTMTLARDDIPSRIELICGPDRLGDHRKCDQVVQLSGNLRSFQVPQVLKQLEVERESDDSVDVLACTSMISVGVDVERLNAMVVLGQPKMSSEYIQASSRVGRGGQHGGVVVVSFSPTKPRDRSHYETFVRFHESMYRWVEPTSVTPHSPPALERALHASVIMVLRLTILIDDNKAGEFDRQNETHGGLCEQLRLRLHKAVDPDDQDEVNKAIDEIIEWWHQASAGGNNLRFKSEPQFDGLMRMHSQQDKPPARATLNSMRNVDGDATAFVIKSGGTT